MQDIQIIGKGSYGKVYEAYDRKKKASRAVKIFRDHFDNVKECTEQPEVKLLTKINHPNIVSLKSYL
jgi:serine/threonine protein kinase